MRLLNLFFFPLFSMLVLPAADTSALAPVDTPGVQIFHLKSEYQPEAPQVRVFADVAARQATALRILYVLPVEAGEEHQYGDGFAELLKLSLKGWIIVEPSFAQLPWYADHPSDPLRRHESYFINKVVPFIDAQFPGAQRQRFLLGFSKSGWGAYAMLLRHPDIFYAAGAWDAPLMKDKPDEFKMNDLFGTQENFEHYRITSLLNERASLLRERKRLYLSGYGNFLKHTQDAHAFLDDLKIPHDYQDGPRRKHIWGSGWLADAVKAFDTLSHLPAQALKNGQ